MQPLAGSDAKDRLVSVGKDRQHVPLNSEAFWKKKSDEVAAEDVFFHEYFNRLGKDKEKADKKSKAKDPVEQVEEAGDDDLSESESEIWKALVDSRPELEGADSDDDLDMDDLESAYEDEDGDGAGGEEEGDDEGVIFNDESDDDMDKEEAPEQPAKTKAETKKQQDEEPSDEDDDFNMDVSDDEAFVGSDEELPMDMAFDNEEEETKDDKSERKKRRKLKHLPTFASADDYAALLAGEDEGM